MYYCLKWIKKSPGNISSSRNWWLSLHLHRYYVKLMSPNSFVKQTRSLDGSTIFFQPRILKYPLTANRPIIQPGCNNAFVNSIQTFKVYANVFTDIQSLIVSLLCLQAHQRSRYKSVFTWPGSKSSGDQCSGPIFGGGRIAGRDLRRGSTSRWWGSGV